LRLRGGGRCVDYEPFSGRDIAARPFRQRFLALHHALAGRGGIDPGFFLVEHVPSLPGGGVPVCAGTVGIGDTVTGR